MKIITILVACEESQAVTNAFNKLNETFLFPGVRFSACSCDLQECSGGHPEDHHVGDAIDFMMKWPWDLVIAHPPCTYLSNAGANSMFRYFNGKKFMNMERYELGMQGRDFFMQFYNYMDVKYMAIENPIPLKMWHLPNPTQLVQPYQFGHPYSKATYLWLRNLPELKPTNIITDHVGWTTGGNYKDGRHDPGVRSAKKRSKTFQGIADAMAMQWGSYLHELYLKGEL